MDKTIVLWYDPKTGKRIDQKDFQTPIDLMIEVNGRVILVWRSQLEAQQ